MYHLPSETWEPTLELGGVRTVSCYGSFLRGPLGAKSKPTREVPKGGVSVGASWEEVFGGGEFEHRCKLFEACRQTRVDASLNALTEELLNASHQALRALDSVQRHRAVPALPRSWEGIQAMHSTAHARRLSRRPIQQPLVVHRGQRPVRVEQGVPVWAEPQRVRM